jgi:hypothetical protein
MEFFKQLIYNERQYGYFQQESATAHREQNSVNEQWDIFSDRIISRWLWCVTLDISICDFCLWRILKEKVYRNTLHTAKGLQNEKVNVVTLVLSDRLQHVRFEVFTAVTMKNGVFWDVMPCDSCKNRRFGGT